MEAADQDQEEERRQDGQPSSAAPHGVRDGQPHATLVFPVDHHGAHCVITALRKALHALLLRRCVSRKPGTRPWSRSRPALCRGVQAPRHAVYSWVPWLCLRHLPVVDPFTTSLLQCNHLPTPLLVLLEVEDKHDKVGPTCQSLKPRDIFVCMKVWFGKTWFTCVPDLYNSMVQILQNIDGTRPISQIVEIFFFN
uniref:Uncharacterized protein n=1 Tax=Oryza punctata TaxID=4537 RepID=A0A0E0LUF2_ORYPU